MAKKNVLLLFLSLYGKYVIPFQLNLNTVSKSVARVHSDADVSRTSGKLMCQDGSLDSRCGRRKSLQIVVSILGGVVVSQMNKPAALADDVKPVYYYTGKTPVAPGAKPRDKGDVKGTKKDPNFLLSISQCKSKCETRPGPDGQLRSKEDCLSECQDICCTTYEQCTFAIVPRL